MTPLERHNEHPPTRITAERFLALPTRDPGRYHVEWRELVNGRWIVFYRGLSCGQVFRFRYRPIVTISAALAPARDPRPVA